MEFFLTFLIGFSLMIFAERIAKHIIKKNHSLKPFITLFVMAVSFALIIAGAVTPTFKHEITDTEFYSMIFMLIGYLIYSGIKQRKTVLSKLKFSYYFSIGCFTYVFIVAAIMTHMLLPFSKYV